MNMAIWRRQTPELVQLHVKSAQHTLLDLKRRILYTYSDTWFCADTPHRNITRARTKQRPSTLCTNPWQLQCTLDQTQPECSNVATETRTATT